MLVLAVANRKLDPEGRDRPKSWHTQPGEIEAQSAPGRGGDKMKEQRRCHVSKTSFVSDEAFPVVLYRIVTSCQIRKAHADRTKRECRSRGGRVIFDVCL